MQAHTFVIASIVVPLVAIAFCAPLIGGKRWKLLALTLMLLGLANYVSIVERFGAIESILRSLVVLVIAAACGYAYQRYFMKADQKGL